MQSTGVQWVNAGLAGVAIANPVDMDGAKDCIQGTALEAAVGE